MLEDKKIPALNETEQVKSKCCYGRPQIIQPSSEERFIMRLSYGMEKIFEQLLLSNASNIPLKRRMELIDSLHNKEILNQMPYEVAKAYIKSSQQAREFYYHLKKLK